MAPFSHVALLITVARYGVSSGYSASPSLSLSSHAVATSNATGVCNVDSYVTAHSILSDPFGRSHTSSPSSPECSEVEPTAGGISWGIATSPECTVVLWGVKDDSGDGTAGVIDATLSDLAHDYGYSSESLLTWSATRFIHELILFCTFNRDKDAVISCGAVLWWFLSQPRVWLSMATGMASLIAHYAGIVYSPLVYSALRVGEIIELAVIPLYLTLHLTLDVARFAALTALLGTARVSLLAIDVLMIALRTSAATVGMSCHLPRLAAFHAAEALLRWRDTLCHDELKIARRITLGKCTGRTRSQRDGESMARLWLCGHLFDAHELVGKRVRLCFSLEASSCRMSRSRKGQEGVVNSVMHADRVWVTLDSGSQHLLRPEHLLPLDGPATASTIRRTCHSRSWRGAHLLIVGVLGGGSRLRAIRLTVAYARVAKLMSFAAAVAISDGVARVSAFTARVLLSAHIAVATRLDLCRTVMISLAIQAAVRRRHTATWEVAVCVEHVLCGLLIHTATSVPRLGRIVPLIAALSALPLTLSGGSGDDRKGPPGFSGERSDFLAWFMAFSAYVAYKLVDAAPVLEGTLPRPPDPPAALHGRLDANGAPMVHPPPPPAPVDDGHGGIANQPAIDAAQAALAAYNAAPVGVINQSVIDAALEAQRDWDKSNTQLYGLLVQSLPTWLVTSVYNSARNDGVASIEYLRNAFDANAGDGGDHAAHLAKLQARTIDGRSDVSEADLRKHFDMMVSEAAAIRRTGNEPPSEATMIAFYDNALPIAYSTMRQHARRSKHATFLAHHMDIMGQVRAEVNARVPAANAFAARGVGGRQPGERQPGERQPGERQPGGGGDDDKICLRCGRKGHISRNCRQPKRACTHCGADHLNDFCSRGPGARRNILTDALRAIVDRQTAQKVAAPAAPTYAAAAAPPPAPPAAPQPAPPAAAQPPPPPAAPPLAAQQPPPHGPEHNQFGAAHAAAAQAAAMHADPQQAANAYAAALRGLGFGMCTLFTAMTSALPSSFAPPPPLSLARVEAFVDTMATFWIVDSVDKLHTVISPCPSRTEKWRQPGSRI